MGKKGTKKKCYAFVVAGEQGIVKTWAECGARTQGRPARYKGFASEAEAQAWLDGGAIYESKAKAKKMQQQDLPEDAIYFDAGTGRGVGTESRVTDRSGASLTWMALDEKDVTKEGNLLLVNRTNNFGELTAFCMAIEIAMKQGYKHILGDSKLVIEYWSKGYISKKVRETDPDLVALAERAKKLRTRFEADGGRVSHVSGDLNPADLGFHK